MTDQTSSGQTKPRLKTPPGATDTHIHIYDQRYPVLPTAVVLSPDALVPAYQAVQKQLGLERVVVVQASCYGTDNACMLEAMKAIGPSSRGVVVVDETVSDAELDRMTKLGVRGIRFHMLKGGVLPWSALEPMAARVKEFGWHVQLQLDGRDLADYEAVAKRLPGTLVIDHTGKFLEPVGIDHPGFKALLRLVEGGKTYVKLAAAYETSKTGAPTYSDVGVLGKALAKAAPDRMLWASNWPHPSEKTVKPDDAMLLDVMLDWVGDDATKLRQLLVDNPARVYDY